MAKDTESYAYAAGGGSAYLRLRGLPFSASTSDVATFFAEYGVSEDQVILGSEGATGRPSGEAWVQFPSEVPGSSPFHLGPGGIFYQHPFD
ncbi:unnamed protein product [Durusdinium trenchii]|uniref:RRM domain-containing protein n=1 Tax=Durusdinium trenchii TaxID=1381693 RepID=A0ABP0PZN4_9DINO